MAEKTEVTALPHDAVEPLLARLGLSAAFASGELQCVVCGRPLNTVGIAAARKSDPGHLVFCCESLDCQEHFHQDG